VTCVICHELEARVATPLGGVCLECWREDDTLDDFDADELGLDPEEEYDA